jgi:hypothetical protein
VISTAASPSRLLNEVLKEAVCDLSQLTDAFLVIGTRNLRGNRGLSERPAQAQVSDDSPLVLPSPGFERGVCESASFGDSHRQPVQKQWHKCLMSSYMLPSDGLSIYI